MKWIMLIVVVIAWVYCLYTYKKAYPSNGYGLAWAIWSIWWGMMVVALLSA